MTLIVTVERYQVITGDTTSAATAVEAALEQAQDLLADELGRGIVHDTYTETLPLSRTGAVYPSVLPITSVPDGYDTYLGAVHNASPDDPIFEPRTQPTATITYTGGWTDETVPPSVARDLAFAARTLLDPTPDTSPIPAGATAVSIGDASVSFGAGGYTGGGAPTLAWSKATLRHRKRRQ